MNAATRNSPFVYLGIASSVVCIRKDDGEIEWSTRLPRTTQLVSLVHEDAFVFAVAGGEISCLDARTGEIRWHNPLKGFGRGWAILAGGSGQDVAGAGAAAAAQAAQAASAAAMMAATSASTAAAS